MERKNNSNDSFSSSLQHANNIASQILRVDLAGFTSEDVVGAFIEKQVKRGEGPREIEDMMSGPKLRSYLKNMKNDLWRSEVALKRGSGAPNTSLEEVEPFYGSDSHNPENLLIQKETATEARDLLLVLMREAGLSETQRQILTLDQQGHSTETIAEMLKTDADTIYSRRSDAMRKLKKQAKRISKR
jgi:DNA-binding CsgD family transcriptional regulator